MNGIEPDVLEVFDGRAERDYRSDVRRAGLELGWRLCIRRALDRDGLDHVATALIRREPVEPVTTRVQDADPSGAEHLVPGEREEVAADGLHVDRDVRRRLGAVEQDRNAARMRQAHDLL